MADLWSACSSRCEMRPPSKSRSPAIKAGGLGMLPMGSVGSITSGVYSEVFVPETDLQVEDAITPGSRPVFGAGTCHEPRAELRTGRGQPPLGDDFAGDGAHGSDRVILGSGQAALEQPRLELVGIGIGLDGADQQLTLERQAERVRRGVALAVPAPSLGRIERQKQRAAHARGSEWAHGRRPNTSRSRERVTTMLTATPRPVAGGRR